MHKAAMPASLAALAAANQGKYKEISTVLFKNFKNLNDDSIKQYAKAIGLDMATYEKDIKAPSIRKIITMDTNAARRFKVRGVPAIFINGRMIRGRSFGSFEQIIKKELKKVE